MSHHGLRRVVFVGAAAGAGLLATYVRLVRPWTMRWEATDEEVARPLPGDRLMARPGFKATRAITIATRPEHIWPWLVQLAAAGPPLWSRRMLYAIVASSGDIVMVRKQLRGIKARAERLAAVPSPGRPPASTPARVVS